MHNINEVCWTVLLGYYLWLKSHYNLTVDSSFSFLLWMYLLLYTGCIQYLIFKTKLYCGSNIPGICIVSLLMRAESLYMSRGTYLFWTLHVQQKNTGIKIVHNAAQLVWAASESLSQLGYIWAHIEWQSSTSFWIILVVDWHFRDKAHLVWNCNCFWPSTG